MALRLAQGAFGGTFDLDRGTGQVRLDPSTGTYPQRFQRETAKALVGDAAGARVEADVAAVVENPAVGITDHLIQNESWTTNTSYASPGYDSFTARMLITGTANNDDGIIVERGGSGSGLVCYKFNGVLYAQCGNGSAFGPAANRYELSAPSPGAVDYELVFSADRTRGAALYVDDALVAFEPTSIASSLWGGNAGGLRQAWSNAAANRGGWTSNGQGFGIACFSTRWFYDQVTWHVAEL